MRTVAIAAAFVLLTGCHPKKTAAVESPRPSATETPVAPTPTPTPTPQPSAQPTPLGSIAGEACGSDGSTMLAGARIWVLRSDGSRQETTSAADGRFLLASVEPGLLTLHIQKGDFHWQHEVTVDYGQTSVLTPVCTSKEAMHP